MIEINESLSLDEGELEFSYSRSSGPGGQHVNRVETRVTLEFDVGASRALSDEQKQRILQRLATRITKDGVLQVTAQRHRSQNANREAAIERFAELLAGALKRPRRRRKTRVPRSERRRRVESKRRRGDIKRSRSGRSWEA